MPHSPLIIANWKSNKSVTTAHAWIATFLEWWGPLDDPGVQVMIAPAFSLIPGVAAAVTDSSVSIAAQDISPFPPGSYTGAVSLDNLQGLGLDAVVIGHSERRRYFQETHTSVAQKVTQALEAGLTPVVCLDESDLELQVAALDPAQLSECIVAYEPVTAIGSGKPESPAEVALVVEKIVRHFGDVPVLYGGSVTAETVADYLGICQGVLVGGASLEVSDFMALVGAALPQKL